MQAKNRSRYHLLGISILLLICFHVYPSYQSWKWQNILDNPTQVAVGTYPSRTTPAQNAYLDYLRNDAARARAGREGLASGSVADQYNFGTYLAIQSVTSGSVTDVTSLQQAERVLSGAVSSDLTANNELAHNLQTVRALLQQQDNNDNEQQEQSGTEQQENSEQQNNNSGTDSQSPEGQPNEPTSLLSENMKQQLEQYQQQLEAEQAQNQQFYDKPGQQNNPTNPFDALDQLFGGPSQLDQQVDNEGQKDR